MQSNVRLSIVAACLPLVVASACRNSPTVGVAAAELHSSHAMSSGPVALTADVNKDIAALRRLTARYNRFDVAKAEGWSAQITPCFESAGVGGMGFHYGNTALIDGNVNVLEPELLLYEPQKDGTLRLVAVEYIVPLDAWTSEQPPQLFGQTFHKNDAFKIWALHVWHVRSNPRGMFADWNPQVSCVNAR
jgi:hypothetical protein